MESWLTCTRLAVVAAILPMPFWLAHWIGTGHWLPGLLVLAFFAFLAGIWVLIYLSHADGTVSDLWNLRRTEARGAELLGRSAEPVSGPTYGEPVYGTSSLPAATYVAGPTTAPGFVRHAFDEPIPVFSLFGPDLRARSQVFSPQACQAERLALVADLAGMFRDGGAPLGSGTRPGGTGRLCMSRCCPVVTRDSGRSRCPSPTVASTRWRIGQRPKTPGHPSAPRIPAGAVRVGGRTGAA
jgi:hypothetical protein